MVQRHKAGKATFSGSTGVTATTLTIAGGNHEDEDSTATFNDDLTATIVLDDNTLGMQKLFLQQLMMQQFQVTLEVASAAN